MKTVTNFGWGVSYLTGTGIKGAVLQVYKFRERKGGLRHDGGRRPIPFSGVIHQRGEADGKTFSSVDEAAKYALERGYLQPYFTAPELRAKRVADAGRTTALGMRNMATTYLEWAERAPNDLARERYIIAADRNRWSASVIERNLGKAG